ncbi:DUF559 domain-containing protein [Nonomuraea sp. NPDC003709]|uniref:DUF559 domain-containing protein n=1 Tax=Nonomuraea sp. NPDC003709 TaxID=3154450 RepID=UPI0033BC615C
MEAVAILDQFARRGVDLEALWHRPLNSWRLRDTLGLADRGAASPRESWLRVILVEGGLPRPTTQIRVGLDDDRFAYLDLGWEEFKVAVEYDGQEHHTSPADQQHDADRREELRRRGWRVIAVRRDVIPGQIADLLHHVANALIECGWQPGPERTNHILRRIRAARRRSRFRLISHPPLQPTTRAPVRRPRPHAVRARTPSARPHRTDDWRRAQMPARRHAGASAGRRAAVSAGCRAVPCRAAVSAGRHTGALVGRSWRNVGPGRAGLGCADHQQVAAASGVAWGGADSLRWPPPGVSRP